MSARSSLVTLLLAAGAGRRMGGPKALLDVGGRSLLAHQAAVFRAAGLEDLLVVVGAEARAATEEAQSLGLPTLVNEAWEAGQTSSLRVGLAGLARPRAGFLIQPIDHAFLRASDLRALRRAFEEEGRTASIFRPVGGLDAFGHPVLFAWAHREEFLALPADAPGHTVYRRHRDQVRLVHREDAPHLGRDLDTPEDLVAHARWREQLGRAPEEA